MSRATGQSSVVWRARPGHVLRAVAVHGLVLAGLTAPPAVAAAVERHWELVFALGAPTLVFTAVGGVSLRKWQLRDLRGIEAIVTLVMLFALGAVLAVPAFMVLGLSASDALFESVSAITSTGLSVATGTMDWSLSGHLLRAWLQWSGGFAIAVAGVAVIVGPGVTAQTLGDVGIGQRDLLQSTRTQARQLLIVYGAITGVGILLLLQLMPSWWEAVVVGLAAVSTGGFTPRPDSLASYSRVAQAVIMLLCLSTCISLMFYVLCWRSGLSSALRATNARGVLALTLSGLLALCALVVLSSQLPASALADVLLNYISALTTAGFSVAVVTDVPPAVAFLLTAMIVGGGVGSTAGGIKIDRAMSALRMIGLTLLRMRTPPRAVTHFKEDGAPVKSERVVSLVAVVSCYAITALVAWIVFLMSGQPALGSLFDIVSALSTVGLSSGVTGPDLAPHLKFVLVAAMFLGRLEFLAVLVALSPSTWSPWRSK
ncbi:TrkH family potassium uptake protein [Stappia stellulata]|uniref:TrkH family potassium uptake protein n=1 Tax=Stappia stellulata TaxID=71235 RepID=UPI00041ED581|nr:potassium transporter TrkG [Stappia stellulata]